MKQTRQSSSEFSLVVHTDTVVSSSCCTSLDYIVTYLFKHIAKEGKKSLRCREATQAGQRLLHFMQQNPEVLQQVNSGCSPSLRDKSFPKANLVSEYLRATGLAKTLSWFSSVSIFPVSIVRIVGLRITCPQQISNSCISRSEASIQKEDSTFRDERNTE